MLQKEHQARTMEASLQQTIKKLEFEVEVEKMRERQKAEGERAVWQQSVETDIQKEREKI